MPKKRSNNSNVSATVMTGNASTISIEVTKVIQMKRGNLINDIPGALMLIIVTRKLNAAAREAMPRICKLRSQKSTFSPGE